MNGINILPYFGRTLGRLCALRRIADTLLSDLEQEHTLSHAKKRLEGLMYGESFDLDLSKETEESDVLKSVGKETRMEARGSYDIELGRFIEKMKSIEESKKKGSGKS